MNKEIEDFDNSFECKHTASYILPAWVFRRFFDDKK